MKGVVRLTAVGLLLVFCPCLGLVTGYKVEPVTAAWSGWAPSEFPNNYVSQQVCCNWDSVVYCELFVGTVGDANNLYQVEVRDAGTQTLVAFNNGERGQDHHWRRFDLTTVSGYKFTKGKTYSFKFTRASGSDSIHYYTAIGSTYPYGSMSVGGQEHNTLDLCMRVYGCNRPITREYFGSHSKLFTTFADGWQNNWPQAA